MVDKLLFGQGVVARGPISHMLTWAYNTNVAKYEYKVALANQMLGEAGRRHASDGTRFHLKFPHAASYAKVAEALRDQLPEVGIILDLQVMEFPAAMDAVNHSGP